MCQIRVVLEEQGDERTLLENVTRLKVKDGGIELSAFFEEPMMVELASVKHIDFLDGKVVLEKAVG